MTETVSDQIYTCFYFFFNQSIFDFSILSPAHPTGRVTVVTEFENKIKRAQFAT
jgi:hypothetical protein